MLKAKLVVKQGQKVMGLDVKDRQTAHLQIRRRILISSSLSGFSFKTNPTKGQ